MASAKQKDRTKVATRDEYDFTLVEFLDALGISQGDQSSARTWSVTVLGDRVTLARVPQSG